MEKTDEVTKRFREDHEVTQTKHLKHNEEYEYEKLEDFKPDKAEKASRVIKLESLISVSPTLTEIELPQKDSRSLPEISPANIDVSIVKVEDEDFYKKSQDRKEYKSGFCSATEHEEDTLAAAEHVETKEEITIKNHGEFVKYEDFSFQKSTNLHIRKITQKYSQTSLPTCMSLLEKTVCLNEELFPSETLIQSEKSKVEPRKTLQSSERQSLPSIKPSYPTPKEIFFGTATTEIKPQTREDTTEKSITLKTVQPLEKGILVNLIAKDQTLKTLLFCTFVLTP